MNVRFWEHRQCSVCPGGDECVCSVCPGGDECVCSVCPVGDECVYSVCPGGDECVCLRCVTICDTPLVHSVAMVMSIHMCWVFQVT